MDLQQVVNNVNEEYKLIKDPNSMLDEFNLPEKYKTWFTQDDSEYYKKLPLLIKEVKARRVLEIGTYSGMSAIMMGRTAELVNSLDITHEYLHEQFKFDNKTRSKSNVHFFIVNEHYYRIVDYSFYDFLFIDIGNHDGSRELWIHNHLLKSKWCGIAVYDDIEWLYMKDFWKQITNNKIKVNWHRETGLGIVEYENN